MDLFGSARRRLKGLKTHLHKHSISRPQSPAPGGNDHKLDHKADEDRAPTPTPTRHVSTDDASTIFKLDRSESLKSTDAETMVGTPAAAVPDIKDPVPTIVIEEIPTSSAATFLSASTHHPTPQAPRPAPPKRRFVQSENAQQDIVALHVAYVVNDSSDLQDLILEIVKVSDEPDFKEIVQRCVGFTTQLVAALDSKPPVDGVHEAIATFLKTIKTVDPNESPEKALRKIVRSIAEIQRVHPDIMTAVQKKHSSRFLTVASGVWVWLCRCLISLKQPAQWSLFRCLLLLSESSPDSSEQLMQQASSNFEWMRWLSATVAKYIICIAVICPRETEQRWTRAIDTLQGKLSKIVQAAEEFSRRSVVSRFMLQGRDKGDIEVFKEDLKAAIDLFNMEVEMNIKLDLDNMSRKIDSVLLDNLPRLPSHKVSHDHYFRTSREEEIQHTLEWIEESDGERFLWIYGAAGVGKSTLARRLLDQIKDEGILAAFAYFAIGIDSDPKDLVRMMARELSSLHPGCRPDVAKAIKDCSGVHQDLDEYITHFLVKPITSLAYAGPLIIILDALDEWAYREQFLQALLHRVNLPHTLSLKFVMTSRYSSGIESIVTGAARVRELTPVSETICRDYFEERFKTVNWYQHNPDTDKFDKLVELADGLLIWAATVCTLVSVSRPNKRPHQILDDILSSSSSLGRGKRMEELYRLAMQRIFPDDDAEIIESRSKILLSMVALKEALPLTEFALLVNVFPEFVQGICTGLRALQTRGTFDESMVQPAIKVFHASFIDYFGPLDQARDVMADNCINFFERAEDLDIVDDPGHLLFRQAELYMGKHWVYHLQEAPEEKRSKAFVEVTSNQLRMWVGWSLSRLVVLGEEYGYGPGSDALKSLSSALVSDQGIPYSPETLSRDTSETKAVVAGFRKALELGNIVYENADFYTQKQDDAQRWAHVINGLAIGIQQIQRLANSGDNDPDISKLEEAINLLENVIKAYSPDVYDHPSLWDNLGVALYTLFEYSGSPDDLEPAISLHTKVRDLRQMDSLEYIISLDNLACALHSRFKHVGSHVDDLEQAIAYHRQTLQLQQSLHYKHPTFLNNLALALHTSVMVQGMNAPMPTLDEVISLHEKAHKMRLKHPAHSPLLLSNLGSALQTRFEYKKASHDLELAFFLHLESVSMPSLGNLDISACTASFARALHLVSQARMDPCYNIPSEYLFLAETEKFSEVYSLQQPSRRYLNYSAAARDCYREASSFLPLTAPNCLTILNNLGLAQQARSTMNQELDLRYADEAIFLHHLILRHQHNSHPMRTLTEQYLERAFSILQEYDIPHPNLDVPLAEAPDSEPPPDKDGALFTSDGQRFSATTSLFDMRLPHHLRRYVRNSGEPIILYRFSSSALSEVWRPCKNGDIDSDGESAISVDEEAKADDLSRIPFLWNLACAAKYLGVWGLPEKILSNAPELLAGNTYHDVVACFGKRIPWDFEHQFLYVKPKIILPDSNPLPACTEFEAPSDQHICNFIQNPLEFVLIFYLSHIYKTIPMLLELVDIIVRNTNELTESLIKEIVELVTFVSLQEDKVRSLVAGCCVEAKKLVVEPLNLDDVVTGITERVHAAIQEMKSATYPEMPLESPSNNSDISDFITHISQFLGYGTSNTLPCDVLERGKQAPDLPLVRPLLDLVLGMCNRYFRSISCYEEEIHFILVVTLAQIAAGIAFVCSDPRYPPDQNFQAAVRDLQEGLKRLLHHSHILEDLGGPIRELILDFQLQVYERSQPARTFILCMGCHGLRLWDRGWGNRWFYANSQEKIVSDLNAESDIGSDIDEEVGLGTKLRLKLKRNLRLGARRKLRSSVPTRIRKKEDKKLKSNSTSGSNDAADDDENKKNT